MTTVEEKRREFLTRLSDLMGEFDVEIDLQDVGTYGGVPEITISHWEWQKPVVFTGFRSVNAADIRKEIEK